jgi:hypothetical protein
MRFSLALLQVSTAAIALILSSACANKTVQVEDKFLAHELRSPLALPKDFLYCRRDAAFADSNPYQCERKSCDPATTNCQGKYTSSPQDFASRDLLNSTLKGIFKSKTREEEQSKKFQDRCLEGNFFGCIDAAGFFMENGLRGQFRTVSNYLCAMPKVKCSAGGQIIAGDKKAADGKKWSQAPDENFLIELVAREGMRDFAVFYLAD